MATWKKILVSGSQAQLAGVTGSFTGSFYGTISASGLIGDVILGTQTSGQYASTIAGGAGLTATTANATDGTAYTIDAVAGAGISLTAPTNDAINIDTGSVHFTGGVKSKMNTDAVHSGSTWTSAVSFTNASNQFTGSFTGSFTGDGSNLTGIATTLDISGSNGSGISLNIKTQDLTIGGTANEIETSVAGTTVTIGLPDNVNITSNLIVGGNFTVNGTTTFVNTTDLYVADKFIVLASGSAGTTDGGIAVDRGTYISASVAYGFDSTTERWGFQNGLADTSNAIVISNPTASAFVNYAFTEATHGVRTGIAGEFLKLGSIYTDNTEDIWIFS